MKRYVILVAGGKGLRMGADIPKQFLPIQGKPLLMHTLDNFHAFDPTMTLILVLPAAQQAYWQSLCDSCSFAVPHRVVNGGDTRFHSVLNGLSAIDDEDNEALVAVHDGVRPFVSHAVIEACFEAASRDGAAVPVTSVVETVRELTADGHSVTVDRSRYRLVQTPQTFRLRLLRDAYRQAYRDSFTDDASVVEALGHPVTLVDGNRENIKITTPYDLRIAEAILNEKNNSNR